MLLQTLAIGLGLVLERPGLGFDTNGLIITSLIAILADFIIASDFPHKHDSLACTRNGM